MPSYLLPGTFENKLQESDLPCPSFLQQSSAFSSGICRASCRQNDVWCFPVSDEQRKQGRLWVLTMQNSTVGTMGRRQKLLWKHSVFAVWSFVIPAARRESRLGFWHASHPDRSRCQRWKAKLLGGGPSLALLLIFFL